MPKTRLISPGSIPNHKLLKNLQLQDNWLSNDGGNEGIRITDAGLVGIGNVVAPTNNFEVFNTNVQYSTGTAYQTTSSIVGSGTTFTSDMIGGRFIFDDGTDAGTITACPAAIVLTVSTSQTVGDSGDLRSYKIYYPPARIDTSGSSTGFKVGHVSLLKDELDISSGDFTIDCAGDINLDAEGSDINFGIQGAYLLNWNASNGLTFKSSADLGDYFRIDGFSNGMTTFSTVDNSGSNEGSLAFQPQGDILFTPAANKDLKATITQKTASGTLDSTFRLTETLNLSSGAGGSDVHYGIWYTQTQTNIGGWDNVYLMYIDGGTDKVFSIDNNANANIDGTLTIDTIAEVGSDTDKFLMSDSGAVKYVTGANLLSYAGGQASLTFGISDTNVTKCGAGIVDDDFIRVNGTTFEGRSASEVLSDIGAQATVTAGTNCTFAGATLNVDDAFIKNDADDTMAGKLTIDVDFTGTTSQSSRGLWIDYDATGDTGAGQNISNIAINALVNSNGQTNSGTVSNYGIYTIATGGTSGTQTSIGGYFKATGADSNYALVTDGGNVGIGTETPDTLLTVDGAAKVNSLKLYEDGSNYVDFDVAADGELTINSIGTAPAITLTAGEAGSEGDINLQAMDGDVFMYVSNNYTNAMHFDIGTTPFFKMRRDLNNWAQFSLSDNGALEISTNDSDGADGDLKFDIDGHVEFEGCGVGFDLITPTYNASDTDVDFTTGNKQFVTFGAGNITDLNLIFPDVSGNFVLLLKQDGTGSRTVTNYKAWDRVNTSAAAGSATVKFAGGSNPDLTDDANHVDIISFFYDADNEIAYGVATLDFQF